MSSIPDPRNSCDSWYTVRMSQLPLDFSPGGAERMPPLTVSELGSRISTALATGVPDPVRVCGEIGTFSMRNGHWYFNLKDDKAIVQCVCWASDARRVQHQPAAGEAVELSGSVVHWSPQGRTQLRVRDIELAGEGDQQAAFRRLCTELRGLGWFAEDSKRPLPRYPRRVAVITSGAGAALQDVLATGARLWPACELVLVDVAVQGVAAASQIAAAIAATDAASEDAEIEAIILTRGGGSAEDLQAFNDRSVAAAIYAASTPIVAAIGHESDTSIAELVADRRASTPTQAAMVLLPNREDESQRIDLLSESLVLRFQRFLRQRLERVEAADRARAASMRRSLARLRQRHLSAETALVARRPHALLAARRAVVEEASVMLRAALVKRHFNATYAIERHQLSGAARRAIARATATLEERRGVLEVVGPEAVLSRGYSVTTDARGRLVRDCHAVAHGDELLTRLVDGSIRSIVTGSEAD